LDLDLGIQFLAQRVVGLKDLGFGVSLGICRDLNGFRVDPAFSSRISDCSSAMRAASR
jgi:hypothetical protein